MEARVGGRGGGVREEKRGEEAEVKRECYQESLLVRTQILS